MNGNKLNHAAVIMAFIAPVILIAAITLFDSIAIGSVVFLVLMEVLYKYMRHGDNGEVTNAT